MGAIAVAGVTIYIWRAASKKAALLFVVFIAVGVADYWIRDEQRPCNERAWFCGLVPDRGVGFVGPPEKVCPEDVAPLATQVFASEGAEKELHRLLSVGVCQDDAIKRVHKGWKAPFHSDFGPWWKRLLYW